MYDLAALFPSPIEKSATADRKCDPRSNTTVLQARLERIARRMDAIADHMNAIRDRIPLSSSRDSIDRASHECDPGTHECDPRIARVPSRRRMNPIAPSHECDRASRECVRRTHACDRASLSGTSGMGNKRRRSDSKASALGCTCPATGNRLSGNERIHRSTSKSDAAGGRASLKISTVSAMGKRTV